MFQSSKTLAKTQAISPEYVFSSKAAKHWQKPKQSRQSMSSSLFQLRADRSAKFTRLKYATVELYLVLLSLVSIPSTKMNW